MKVLWGHNFNPENPVSGIFMHQMYSYMSSKFGGALDVDLYYMGNLRNPLVVFFQIIRMIVIGGRYDVTHAQFGSVCGWICSFSRSKYKAITLRGSDWYENLELKGLRALHGRLQRYFTICSLRKYDLVIVTSNRIRDEIAELALGLNVVVIPSPIDPEKFYPMDKCLSKKQLNLDLEVQYFLYPVAAKNNPIKRPWLIAELRKHLPHNVEIITASGVPHNEMVFLYNSVEAIVLPSMYEGWPNVVKEALLCNIPFVATDVSDLKEVSAEVKACLVVDPTVEAFLDAIISHDFKCDISRLRKEVIWMNMGSLSEKLFRSYQALV